MFYLVFDLNLENILPPTDELETEVPLRSSNEYPLPIKPVATIKPIQSDKYPPVPLNEFPSYFWASLDNGLLQKQWEVRPSMYHSVLVKYSDIFSKCFVSN